MGQLGRALASASAPLAAAHGAVAALGVVEREQGGAVVNGKTVTWQDTLWSLFAAVVAAAIVTLLVWTDR